jgi:predicted RNA-binding protein with PUA-like domain
MAYWLMKSEPETYSWADLVKEKRTGWNGVRNFQANNNMKTMKTGDEAFFYHSGKERAIIGIMKVVRTWHPDPADQARRFGMVDVTPLRALEKPVTLQEIKQDAQLKQMVFVRQGRLSVSPVTAKQWKEIVRRGGQ